MKKDLKDRFIELWTDQSSQSVNGLPVIIWEQLAWHYSGPGRHYHTLDHLQHCIGQMDMVQPSIKDPKALELAIYFHDVICDPDARDNEQRSADWFEQAVDGRLNRDLIGKVKGMIMATTHTRTPLTHDQKLICDIDLSSFGLPWEAFLKDSEAVRAEHVSIPDPQFYPGKINYLNAMLDKPAIFYTKFFHRCYEARARENIARYLENLIEPKK